MALLSRSAPPAPSRTRRAPGAAAAAWALALAVVAVVGVAGLGAPAPAAAQPSEYEVKAAFLYNFTKFVDWPLDGPPADSANPTSRFVFCVLGDDPFGRELEAAVAGKRVGPRSAAVRLLTEPSEADPCAVLYVGRSERSRLPEILAALRDRAVLTVGDWDGFVGGGGMIGFVQRQRRVRFRIDQGAARAAGLAISAKLLDLADGVVGGGGVPAGAQRWAPADD